MEINENTPLLTADVFVPGREPIYNYNPRTSSGLEDQLQRAVEDGGAIVSLTGPTKTGKTVLLRRLISEDGALSYFRAVWIDGEQLGSIDDFWHVVARDLEIRIVDQVTDNIASNSHAEVGVDARLVKGSAGKGKSYRKELHSRIISTLSREVSDELLSTPSLLVIDDFHFVSHDAQTRIIQALKPLIFRGLRVVFASITHRWNDITEAVEDMGARVAPINIPNWTERELGEIVSAGCDQLNVEISSDVIARLTEMSFGSPHIIQHLCRELIRTINGISMKEESIQHAEPPTDWDKFFRDCTFEDSKRWFSKLLAGPKVKGTPRITRILKNGDETDIYGLVLEAISSTGPKFTLTLNEVTSAVQDICNTNVPKPQETSRVLTQMSKIASMRIHEEVPDDEDEIWDQTFENYGHFSGSQPVLDYVAQDSPEAAIHISDPFFAYYLRWGKRT